MVMTVTSPRFLKGFSQQPFGYTKNFEKSKFLESYDFLVFLSRKIF
jgi:hypothetical protein